MKKQKKDVLKICFVLFVLFFSIAFLFPYTGDDWTWGSDAGIAYFETFFAGYNGRYLGNLLVLALTRSKLLDAMVMAGSYVLVCFFCCRYSEENVRGGGTLWLAAILFFIMPKEIWAQTIVWTSGFSNYVPSALITAVFLFSVRRITDTEFSNSKKISWKSAWMFVLGFSGALFVENVTVFHIGFALLVIIYTYLKFRKYDSGHIAFFCGAILGACVMLSNSAYHNIVMGDDYYRNTPQGIGESVKMIIEHAADILTYLIYNNLLFCGIVTVLLVALGEFRKLSDGEGKTTGWLFSRLHLGCFLLVLCKDSMGCLLERLIVLSRQRELLLEIGIALLYVLSVLLVIWQCVEKERRVRMLLPLGCAVGSLMPLLVVNPIGPRCAFIGYFFMMVFVVDLAGYLRTKVMPDEKWLSKLACLIALMQSLAVINVFYPVYCCETMRSDFIKRQAEEGRQTVFTCELPNSEYLWNSIPAGESLSKRYKQFHKLDENVQIEIIPCDELIALSEVYQ